MHDRIVVASFALVELFQLPLDVTRVLTGQARQLRRAVPPGAVATGAGRQAGERIALFENEYRVPLLSPLLAACSGTAAELALPVLFAFGLASRPVAVAFFVFNAIAVVSYPDISDAGTKDHVLWGTMMLVILFFGAGRLSIDHWLRSRIAGAAARG
jgi:uncharacterized membrane protein YphA (DoxX/SURF4 family)